MSISYSGTFTRSGGIVAAIGKQMKLVNLKPLKSINIKFDPFHENAQQTRLVRRQSQSLQQMTGLRLYF